MVLLCSQTCLLRKAKNNNLENLLRITVENAECENAELYLNNKMIWNGSISGSVSVDCWIEEPSHKENITLSVKVGENTVSEVFSVDAPKHFEVHLVHLSHADPGYTDLMSHVFELHSVWIDKILDEMDKRDDYPYDERLRITIEQFWLLENFLEHAPKDRIDKLINRVKKGDIEITALYGNLITEQLGHEECYRAMYPARRFGQLCGRMPITASHCDIPGVSWGLCRALCDADIKFLAADFPSYYDNWGSTALVPFWNSKKAFGYDGPGACMWKSPDGKKLLLWDSHSEIAESWDDKWIENLADRLVKNRYPYDVYRATVKAWNIDNSCYIPDYADGALKWNKKYAYPHIVVSTNEMFYRAFTENAEKMNIPIPEVKGDLPGQDYPTGAMSMAPITSSARKNTKDAGYGSETLYADCR